MNIRHSKQLDMLHGSLVDKILLFALPIAASSILQQLFNSADIAVAGKFAGSTAQSAVGVNGPVINLLINLFVGLSVGANVAIANYIGQGKQKEAREVVHTAIPVAVISGVFLLILGQFAAPPMLKLINTPDDTIMQATAYLRIYFLGMPFIMVYNFGAAILRSVGDTKRPLVCLVISGVINVGLNLLFVIVFHLGAAGVAIATTVSNGISASLVFYFLLHAEECVRVDVRRFSIDKAHLRKMIVIGVPAGVQGMIFSLSNLYIQSAVNSFGSGAIAGYTSAANFESFTFFVLNAFSQAAVTFTGQNFGARQFDRCKKIFRLCTLLALLSTGIMCAFFVLARVPLVHLFTKDPEAIRYALVRVMHVTVFAWVPVLYEVTSSALRGIGHSLLPTVLTLMGTFALRMVWVFTVFAHYHSFEMLVTVYPVTWALTSVFVLTVYFCVRKKEFARQTRFAALS